VDRRTLAAAIALALLAGVPFASKAFHIDDTLVLTISQQILREPLRPFHAEVNWRDDSAPIAQAADDPPLLSYYLAPFIRLFGASELWLHAAMVPFFIMLAAGTGLLGRWFWAGEGWPMLFVMSSPVLLVSGNVMSEVPAAALATLGLALFVFGMDEERRGLCAWGAVLVGLAALTKYSAAALVPLLALYPLLRRKPRLAAWALVPVALFGLWCLQSWLSLGRPHPFVVFQQRAGIWRSALDRLYPALTIAGSMLLLPPVLAVAWMRRRAWLALPLLAAVAAAAWCGVNHYFHGDPLAWRGIPTLSWQYYLWAMMGAALLAATVGGGLAAAAWYLVQREQGAAEWVFLVAWAAAPFLFGIFLTPLLSASHLLLALPPVVVLGMRLLTPPRGRVRVALAIMLVVQAGVAALVAAADYEQAEAGRAFARQGIRRYGAPGQQVWFNGHWGWQHYALAAGARQYATHGEQPKPGDLILAPKWLAHAAWAPDLEASLETVDEVPFPARVPARTMDGWRSSFYAVTAQRAPYFITFADTPVQVGLVFRVRPADGGATAPRAPAGTQ